MTGWERDEPVPVVCRRLRTKTAFGALIADSSMEPAPWQTGFSTTAVYWCLATMEGTGPDDRLAHPQRCCEGRECFRSPFED